MWSIELAVEGLGCLPVWNWCLVDSGYAAHREAHDFPRDPSSSTGVLGIHGPWPMCLRGAGLLQMIGWLGSLGRAMAAKNARSITRTEQLLATRCRPVFFDHPENPRDGKARPATEPNDVAKPELCESEEPACWFEVRCGL